MLKAALRVMISKVLSFAYWAFWRMTRPVESKTELIREAPSIAVGEFYNQTTSHNAFKIMLIAKR